jgi:hypothetical protein
MENSTNQSTGIKEYLEEYEIDLDATEGLDYLIEVINNDLIDAVNKQDYQKAHRCQCLIENLNPSL